MGADKPISQLTEDVTPTLDDALVTVDLASSANRKVAAGRLIALVGYPCQGRLTTESGVPVSTTDRTAQGTIYFTPYNGNVLALYTAGGWRTYAFSEFLLPLTVTSGKNYDVFAYDNTGTPTLELSAPWTTDTARADAIGLQDGVDVKSVDHSRRLVATIRASGANVTEDSLAKRFVWNRHNRIVRSCQNPAEGTDSWQYSTNQIRQANGNAANQFEYVCGVAEDLVQATIRSAIICNNGSASCRVGVGVDSAIAIAAGVLNERAGGVNSTGYGTLGAIYQGIPGVGYHFITWLESGNGTATITWEGDNGGGQQSGIVGSIRA